ncbi:hypothetical protein BGX38DRAFT_1092240 [Terfezia claveryi]|nr:hypothetical protein BGX38DRAFT_1092240 [Terfezia claveryi]
MYGDLGLKLVQHAKRTQTLSHLPPYQSELIRAITREVRDLDRDVTETLEPYPNFDPTQDPALATLLLANHICIRRNKRCLLAYHRVRVEKIEEMCWSGSDILEQVQATKGEGQEGEAGALGAAEGGSVSSLSPEEEEYARQYNDLLAAYKGQWTDIDLTGSLDPPRDLFIDVRVLKDAGEIQTEYGAINLTKNSQFFVRQGDVERLIAQGFLQKLS